MLKFIVMVLQSMEIEVELPITVYADNIGAVFLENNCTSSDHTKHMDIHYHLSHEYVEHGMIKIKFIKSVENNTDLLTKNSLGHLFEKHRKKSVWKCNEVDAEVQQEGY